MARKIKAAPTTRAEHDPATTPPVAAAAELFARQPQLIMAALGTIGAGIAARRGDLTRGGARMLAVQLVAGGLTGAVRHRVERRSAAAAGADGAPPAPGAHHLTDAVIGGAVGWVAEALVGAVFDRLDPSRPRGHGAAGGALIPPSPRRLAGR